MAISAAPQAQGAPVVARPVVQALPNPDQQKLNAALARLGRDPRDVTALLDAGDAARKLGDFDAAIGFYRRADEISSGNARVKAGLAASLAQNGDPLAAIPLFAEAERAGASPTQLAADRGLAYDLVGDNAAAQRYYAQALGGVNDDEVRMRMAISQAIAGDAAASEITIMPLLRKQDKPGWRTRAFSLAIAGDVKQAVEVSNTILPPQLAQNIAPYLRYMPRLTRAQQAAAANLGKFPRASEIGRDDPRIAAYAPPRVAAADANLVPRGEALGSGKASSRTSRSARAASTTPRTTSTAAVDPYRIGGARTGVTRPAINPAPTNPVPARIAPPEPRPTIERADAATGELPAVKQGVELPPMTTHASSPALAAAPQSPPAAAQPATTAPRTPPASSGFDLARVSPSQPASTAPAPVAVQPAQSAPTPALAAKPAAETPPVPSAQQLSLEQIFADLGKPTMQIMPASGAVDIRQIEPARPAPPKIDLPKPAAESKAEDKPDEKADPKAAKAGTKADPKAKADAKDKSDAKPGSKAAKAEAAKAEAAKAKKPAPPAHPSRIWVQIGVGRDKDAIAFDWRRKTKQSATLFKGHQPYISDMGRTNRVLVGPFETQKAASAFIADAKKQGFADALPWTSPAGQVVDSLPLK